MDIRKAYIFMGLTNKPGNGITHGTEIFTWDLYMRMGLTYGHQKDIYLWHWRISPGMVLRMGLTNALGPDKYAQD